MLTFFGNGKSKKYVYMVQIDVVGECNCSQVPTKVFLNKKTAENRKNKVLEIFHDIKAKVVPVELVEE
jgi:hypothetical protein